MVKPYLFFFFLLLTLTSNPFFSSIFFSSPSPPFTLPSFQLQFFMSYPKYPVIAGNDPYIYEFYSAGPRGKIRKGVFYTPLEENLFNLGFGDWNGDLHNINDESRSNNGDRDLILATVAFTVMDFTDKFPKAGLFVAGSTPARTRLYQMGIAYNYLEIKDKFEIMGFIDGDWKVFRTGCNFEAFLITRKY